MLIEEFLDRAQQEGKWKLRNEWLLEPEWNSLYVRFGVLSVTREDGSFLHIDKAIHLASFEAIQPRTGAFTQLVQRIEAHSPNLPIFVENVFDKEFAKKLSNLGFEQVWTCTREFGNVGSWCFLKGHV